MTSASELFHSRRSRFGLRHSTVDDSPFDSYPADTNSSVSHHHRSVTTTNRRHHHQFSSLNNRREHRHDLDGCDPPTRRIHRHRLTPLDLEPVHTEQGSSHSPSGSIINSEDFRSIRRQRATGNDRLPGAVLLARERLVERLRGVSVSGNRQNSRSASSSTHQDDGFIEADNNLLEITGDWLEEIADSWQAVMPMASLSPSRDPTRNRPPGLAQDAINSLPLEVFKKSDEISSASKECTICLEGFEDGDDVIRLNCAHRFHSCCLFPWVEVCGACPNCRKTILITRNRAIP